MTMTKKKVLLLLTLFVQVFSTLSYAVVANDDKDVKQQVLEQQQQQQQNQEKKTNEKQQQQQHSLIRSRGSGAADVSNMIKKHSNKTLCDHIRPDELPNECTCKDIRLGLIIECDKTFQHIYFNDTIGMKINIDPCNELGSSISLDITEKKHSIDYRITGIKAGEQSNIPIPGASIIVPVLGHVGLDATVLLYGNPDQLTIKIGLNACIAIGPTSDTMLCASSIPLLDQILPWYVLKGKYSFGDICGSNSTTSTTTTTTKSNTLSSTLASTLTSTLNISKTNAIKEEEKDMKKKKVIVAKGGLTVSTE